MATNYTWERRIARAEQLAPQLAHARNILTFYVEVLKWQRDLSQLITAAAGERGLTGFFEMDHLFFLDQLGSLLELAKRQGSEALTRNANELAAARSAWKELLASYWNGELEPEDSFFARACLQPYLELLASTQTRPSDSQLTASSTARGASIVAAQLSRACPF